MIACMSGRKVNERCNQYRCIISVIVDGQKAGRDSDGPEKEALGIQACHHGSLF